MDKKLIGCMGGFCSMRDRCAHYWSESDRISERLCADIEEPAAMVEHVVKIDYRHV